MSTMLQAAEALAFQFTSLLLDRRYAGAHALLTAGLQESLSVEQLTEQFESSVDLDWQDGVVFPPMFENPANLPDAEPGDLGWYYVPIGGDVYSEAVTVIVGEYGGRLSIRELEIGRP